MSLHVLARWFLDVCFQVTFFKTTMISQAGAASFGARSCHLASLVPQFWDPGDDLGCWGTLGGPRQQQTGHLKDQGQIFSDSGWISEPHLESSLGTEDSTFCIDFRVEFWTFCVPKTSFDPGPCAQKNFSPKSCFQWGTIIAVLTLW